MSKHRTVISAKTNSHTIPNSQPLVFQSQEQLLGSQLNHQSFQEIVSNWLPKGVHELVYCMLVVVCTIEAIRTNNTYMLMALWTAAAAQIGVPTAQNAFTNIVECIAYKEIKKQRQSKTE